MRPKNGLLGLLRSNSRGTERTRLFSGLSLRRVIKGREAESHLRYLLMRICCPGVILGPPSKWTYFRAFVKVMGSEFVMVSKSIQGFVLLFDSDLYHNKKRN